ncbi:MAG: hypothetical protein BZ138_02820 [Methanosphaera sp. rholeuAM270]|nr:MAG: hypothetical protein BZ138_02820 [Methanosphaera sp. rholeuAM270]
MDNIKSYNYNKYKTEPNKFTRKGKMSFEDYVISPIVSEGRTTFIEVNSYLRNFKESDDVVITRQASSYQRTFIEPLVYKDMMLDTLVNMVDDGSYRSGYKDMVVMGVDGSDIDLPPHKITMEEFNIPDDTLVRKQPAQTLCSLISDLYNNYIWEITLANADDDERSLFIEQLTRLNDRIELNNVLFVFDRGYASIELFLECLEKGTNFIFRLKSGIYKDEREKMTSDDEYVNLKLNSTRTKNIRNHTIKEKVKTMQYLRLRIVNIPIKQNDGTVITETLITNLPPEKATPDELKKLYEKRWDIEKNYDKMKNILEIENYSGYRKCIIQQDTYAQAFLLNFLHAIKHDMEKQIPKHKKKSKNAKLSYQINMNTLAGNMIELMPQLLTDNPQERQNIMKYLEHLALINLSSSKTEKTTYPRNKNARKYKYKLHKRRSK